MKGDLDIIPPLPDAAPAPAPAAAPAPAGPKRLIGPDGLPYTVPESSVPMALQHGWRTEESIEQEKAAYHESAVTNRLASKEGERGWGAWQRFGNEALLGMPETAREAESTPEENAIEAEAEKKFLEKHPIEGYGAKAAGFIAPMALPGVGAIGKLAEESVAKVATEGIARKIAGSAAKVAAESAVYSAPQAAVQAAYGDPERAAETMLWGVGLGAALGAGGKALGLGAKAAVEAGSSKISDILAHKQANGVTVLDDVARNVLGISDKEAQKLGPQRLSRIVERADEEGILGMDPKKRIEAVEAMRKDAGAKIGEHREALEGLLDKPEFADMGPKATEVASDVEKAVSQKYPELRTELHKSNFDYWQKIDASIRSAGEDPSFEGLQKVRQAIKSEGKAYNRDSVQAKIAELADATIRKHIDDAAQRVYESGGLKEKFADYVSQKERYEAAKALGESVNLFKGTGRLPHGASGPGFGDLMRLGLHSNPVTGALHVAGHHVMKAFMANKFGLLGKSVSFLRKAAEDPATAPLIGGFMAKEGAAALDAHIEALPEILSASKAPALASADVVQEFIGPTTGLTKQQQYDKLTNTITQASVNGAATADRIGGVASAFSGTNVQLASLVAGKKLAALSYLQTQIPKDPNPPRAFQKNEWKPTPQQQRDFLSKTEIVANPMVVWDHYQNGALTRADRDTLMAVYPTIYKEMVAKIQATAYGPNAPKLSREKVLQLAMFTGLPLDSSLKNLSSVQQALQSQGQGQGQGQQQQGPTPSARPKLKAPNAQTDTQRRTYGESAH